MGFQSVLSFAHKLIGERLQPGEMAVDATAGTGADTLFLAGLCGARGHVYAFDIQFEALQLTRERLDKGSDGRLAPVTLLLQSHADMIDSLPSKVQGTISAVMFNLGYLPSPEADQSLITNPGSTLAALEQALKLLRPGGIVTVVLYPGHPGGREEAHAVEAWASDLPQIQGQALLYRQLQKPDSPYLIAIEKRKKPIVS